MTWWPWPSQSSSSTDVSVLNDLKDDVARADWGGARHSISTTASTAYGRGKAELHDLEKRWTWLDSRSAIVFAAGASTALSMRWFAVRYLRRIRSVDYIKPEILRRKTDLGVLRRWMKTGFVRRRQLLGKVTSVGDGDNFHFFHTPGGRLAGWSWLRRIPTDRNALRGETIHIRMAGVDAPELAHFGRPAQPFGEEALNWLRNYILGRRVRVELHRRDQYDRIVGSVWVRRGLFRRDVSLEMLKCGLATVYEGSFGVEFGGYEEEYRNAEEQARQKKIGMWTQPGLLKRMLSGDKESRPETPREYKTRIASQEKEKIAPSRHAGGNKKD